MTPTRVGLLGLLAGTTTTVLLTRLFVQALREIDVEIALDPFGMMGVRASATRRLVTAGR